VARPPSFRVLLALPFTALGQGRPAGRETLSGCVGATAVHRFPSGSTYGTFFPSGSTYGAFRPAETRTLVEARVGTQTARVRPKRLPAKPEGPVTPATHKHAPR